MEPVEEANPLVMSHISLLNVVHAFLWNRNNCHISDTIQYEFSIEERFDMHLVGQRFLILYMMCFQNLITPLPAIH